MTNLDQATDQLPLSPLPEPGRQREQLAQHRLELARATDDHAAAADILEASLRAGLWRYARLWLEFAALKTGDYPRLKTLWLDSPKGCRAMRSAITVVARAAALADDHDEARLLMRKALLLQAQHGRRLSTRFKRVARLAGPDQRIAVPDLAADDDAALETKRYFALYEAKATGDGVTGSELIAALRRHGEGEWLDRL